MKEPNEWNQRMFPWLYPYGNRMNYLSLWDQPERMEDEEDFRRLQEMYPIMARRLKPYVDEVCSLLEYPGSMMYDEYPDQLSLRKKSLEIWERAEKGERFGKDAPGAGAGFDRCTFAAGDDVPKKDQQETVYPGKSN